MADGRAASSTDRRTWASWSEVADVPHGVMLGDGLGCIDLDHCLNDGHLSEEALEVLSSVDPIWVEVSMSGDGLHAFVEMSEAPGSRSDGVEIYSRARFIAVTGQRFEGNQIAG